MYSFSDFYFSESFSLRWNSCKQNKQGANNCTPNQNQTPSPEGEKLHSDSGISVDSQSLQEQQSQTQAQTGNTHTYNTCICPDATPLIAIYTIALIYQTVVLKLGVTTLQHKSQGLSGTKFLW